MRKSPSPKATWTPSSSGSSVAFATRGSPSQRRTIGARPSAARSAGSRGPRDRQQQPDRGAGGGEEAGRPVQDAVGARDLDDVALADRQLLVASLAVERELRVHPRDRGRPDRLQARDDAAVLARPRVRDLGIDLVDLHAIELVLQAPVAVGGGDLARVGDRGDVGERRGQRRRDAREERRVACGGAGLVGVDRVQRDLPDGLRPRRGVGAAERGLEQLGRLVGRHVVGPDVEDGGVAAVVRRLSAGRAAPRSRPGTAEPRADGRALPSTASASASTPST